MFIIKTLSSLESSVSCMACRAQGNLDSEIPAAARGIGQEVDWEAGWVLSSVPVILAYEIQ